jgi:serine/threonine protein kinase
VYIGRLPDGREVAIKWTSPYSQQGIKEFQAEVTILPSINHKHIVRLFGSCVRGPQEKRQLLPKLGKKQKEKQRDMLAVFEFTENRSLDIHLHGQPSPGQPSPVTASWKMRIEILLGVSRAIEYLQSYAERPVIHRDVKSSNILLDASWEPRLTDFGLALSWEGPDNEDIICGTLGYLAPEYAMTGTVNLTTDVYSFGVVMLEVLTGKKAYYSEEEWEKNRDEWKETEKEVCQEEGMTEEWGEETEERAKPGNFARYSLVELAVPLIEAGELRKVLDRRPAKKPTPRQLEAAELVAQVAVRCVQLQWEARPSISEVVGTLQVALELAYCDV